MKNWIYAVAFAALLVIPAGFAGDNSVTVLLTKPKPSMAQASFSAAAEISSQIAAFPTPTDNSVTVIMAKPKPFLARADFSSDIAILKPSISAAEAKPIGSVNVLVKQFPITTAEPQHVAVSVIAKGPTITVQESKPVIVGIVVKGPVIVIPESKPLSASLSADIKPLQPQISEKPPAVGIAMATNFRPNFGGPAQIGISLNAPVRSLPQEQFSLAFAGPPLRDMDRDFDP